MKKEHIKIKITGPQGSGKTILIRAIQKLLLDAGIGHSVENVSHAIELPILDTVEINKLLKK